LPATLDQSICSARVCRLTRLEVNDKAYGHPCAVRVIARRVQPDVVQLRSQSQMRQHLDVDAASHAVSELIAGSAACRYPRATDQSLHKRGNWRRVAQRQARPEEIRVRIDVNPSGRPVVTAEVTDHAQPPVRVIRYGPADAVLV